MDTQIEKAFKQIGNYVFTDANALGRCRTIAEEHGLKANDVASHYDAFAAVRWAGPPRSGSQPCMHGLTHAPHACLPACMQGHSDV